MKRCCVKGFIRDEPLLMVEECEIWNDRTMPLRNWQMNLFLLLG
jgi:hypothetical protein